jgi:hypothetical protein
MSKQFFKMQKLAGLITESQYKKLLEDISVVDRILDKMSTQGKDSLTPEEKAYLDKYSKGEKDLEAPIRYIKLNLPKDINSSEIIDLLPEDEEADPFYDIVVELTKLNPQINSELFKNDQGIFEDVVDEVESGTKKEILSSYFYWLFRGLVWNIYKYSNKEADERATKYDNLSEKFRDYALKGQWMVVPTVTDDSSSNLPNKKLIDPDHLDPNDIWKGLDL